MTGLIDQLERVIPFVLVLCRMSGLFLAAPMLSSLSIPFQAKVLASFIAAAAVFPSIESLLPAHTFSLTLWSLAPLIVAELTVGLVLGMLAALPIMAMQAGGHIMGFQMGLSMASVYNPELDTQSDVVGELIFMVGTGLFVLLGGLDVMMLSLLASFERVPLGSLGLLGQGPPLELYTQMLTSGFELAIRVSAPVTATTFLLLLAMGFIMKTMPQINVLTVGFAIKILVGIGAIIASMMVISDIGYDHTLEALDSLLGWVEGLGTPPTGGQGG